MVYDLQKAGLMKRISAWVLDLILLSVLAVGFAWIISDIVGFDEHSVKLENYYNQYETEYGTSFEYSQEEYMALSEEERAAYDAAYEAMIADEDVVYTYNLVLQLTLLLISLGIFLAVLVLEFLIPLWLRNGQTVGKKIFGLAVMRTNGVRIGAVSLFIRAILGKYTIETMIPVFIITMWLLSILGFEGTIVLGVILLVQLVLLITTPTNSLIHDKLSDSVVVDMSSQMIFASEAERLEYQQRLAAEDASRRPY